VRRNEAFRGLSLDQATQLNSYMHFRNVQSQRYKQNLDLPNAPFNQNFLEPLVNDFPQGLWCIQKENYATGGK